MDEYELTGDFCPLCRDCKDSCKQILEVLRCKHFDPVEENVSETAPRVYNGVRVRQVSQQEAKKMSVKKSAIKAAAEELNEVMGLDPAIDVKNTPLSDLRKLVVESGEMIETGDDISAETLETIRQLRENGDGTAEAQETKPPKADKPKAKEAKAEKPKADKPHKMSRVDAVVHVLRDQDNAITKAKLAEKANKLYVKNGGTDNDKESTWATNLVIQVLTAFGAVETGDDGKIGVV